MTQRENLIIVSASERSQHYAWLDGDPSRNWDLTVLPYRDVLPPVGHDVYTQPVTQLKKFAGLHECLSRSAFWKSYAAILLIDEDLFAMPGTFSRFFQIVDQIKDFQLGAPALTPNSIAGHAICVQNPISRWRRVSFVESMMPCFTPEILEDLLPTFIAEETGVGWGLDLVWPKLLNYRGIYIIDETPVTHWRPALYTRSYMPEVRGVMQKYDAQWLQHTYEYVR